MAEEIKQLIEKIQAEGIAAAEIKAKEIEETAKIHAAQIVEKAETSAEKIINEAKNKAAKMEESVKIDLKQASRDTLIGLKKEINTLLNKIITQKVNEALKPEDLAKIITQLIKNNKEAETDIIVSLSKEDLSSLEKGFLNMLKTETKKSVTLKASENIRGGFVISFDAGKSQFDFTDKALAEYIGAYLRPKLAEILKD